TSTIFRALAAHVDRRRKRGWSPAHGQAMLSCTSVYFSLDDAHVLGARALRTAAFVVGHLLAFAQILVPTALDGRHVKEHVLARAVVDESETLIAQTLDRTFCHRCL